MKKICGFVASLILLLAASGLIWAKESKTVVVLPFTINSAENIEWVQQAVLDMISTRISANSRIDVTPKDKVAGALREKGKKLPTEADIYTLGKKLNADYVVWGSISKIGNNMSMDGKLTDIATYKPAMGISSISHGMEEMIPKVNDFAQKISDHILGIKSAAPSATAQTPPITATTPQATTTVTPARESDIIAGMKKSSKGTLTSAINPDFINAFQPVDRRGFWMSEKVPVSFRGMDIGDVNGDGLNEIVVSDRNNIRVFQKKGKEFRMLQKISGKSYDNYIALDVADINKNSLSEIIVTNLAAGNRLSSFVLEWNREKGKFVEIASNLILFLRVLDLPSGKILIGQTLGIEQPFSNSIHEITWENGKYIQGKKMSIPRGLSVYGLTIDVVEVGGSERIIALDDNDYLCIYEQTDKPIEKLRVFGGARELLYRSDEPFGGNNLYVDYFGREYSTGEADEQRAYLNSRILTVDTNRDGKKEIILVKNLSPTGRILKKVKIFTASEIYNLEWDGLGLLENWHTRKINGYVSDYQFKDVDNDGEKEIVMALVMTAGQAFGENSVLVSYKMTAPQQNPPPKAQ